MKGFDLMAILLNPEFGKMLWHGVQMTLVIAVGSWLLAMVAAGLIAFGLFAFVEARFRRIHVPDELSPGGPSPHQAA